MKGKEAASGGGGEGGGGRGAEVTGVVAAEAAAAEAAAEDGTWGNVNGRDSCCAEAGRGNPLSLCVGEHCIDRCDDERNPLTSIEAQGPSFPAAKLAM